MDILDLLRVLGPYLTGGLVGALVSAAIAHYRSRVQPIHYETSVLPLTFKPDESFRLTAIDPRGDKHAVFRLFTANVFITNRSNQDFDQFDFGLTLPPGLTALEVDIITPDRGHTAEKYRDTAMDKAERPRTMEEAGEAIVAELLRMEKQTQHEIDFKLKPFSRGDTYTLQLAVVPMVIQEQYYQKNSDATLTDEGIQLNTPLKGVRFARRRRRRWLSRH